MSAGAALEAMKAGLTQVAALQGGWAAWLAGNYPVEGRAVVESPIGAAPVAGEKGDPDAPVTIVEYTDYQCGYCARHALQTVPQIQEIYIDTGKVRYVVKDFPLSFHANARPAAVAARCAGAQDAYWQMHDHLFEKQTQWAGLDGAKLLETFASYADVLGLDVATFKACLSSGEFDEVIAANLDEGQQAGVQGTPSFLINGRLMVGAYPFAEFQERIEAALALSP
ncbi:MAG: thioredoxin domain-containing protein [Anaerolineae bacterium]